MDSIFNFQSKQKYLWFGKLFAIDIQQTIAQNKEIVVDNFGIQYDIFCCECECDYHSNYHIEKMIIFDFDCTISSIHIYLFVNDNNLFNKNKNKLTHGEKDFVIKHLFGGVDRCNALTILFQKLRKDYKLVILSANLHFIIDFFLKELG